ncbi:hypothetical protein N7468_006477 [Penicillium chermesinum]|uniref:Nephrocystin 3-like N-terminal domain-containing protein n=1 Tax=Penicillium chermesinum TaxID=63820 RepID=A0A9W9NSA8_9EURO|nr:uncharacterized protein N7468_006477 [Penicillium chermesinum]KAJ5225252.1 hypothetical protein N7468_006477 [Penicillium chermesinum]
MQPQIAFHGENRGTQIGVNNGTVNIHEDPPLVILEKLLASAPQAIFDSRETEHEDVCLPGTRTEVLHEIQNWATSTQQERCIFWLCGVAGTGKSTISRSVAQIFTDGPAMGASFFFKRGETDRGNATRLFPTIAKQLATKIPGLLSYMTAAASDNPGIAERAMKVQFEKILIEPLKKLDASGTLKDTISVVLVVDALDECDGDKDIRWIIQLLPQLNKLRVIRLRVFLTSRPELPLRLGFRDLAEEDHQDLILHEIPKPIISHDISLFLNYHIAEIRTERDQPLPMDWPGEAIMQRLVDLCVPLFIIAATICRVLRDEEWDPYESLPEILAHQKTNDGDKLDGTYLPVLNRILWGVSGEHRQQVIEDFQQIVGTIIILETPLSVSSLSRLLNTPSMTVRHIYFRLGQLHSVLRVPKDVNSPLRLFHLSFRDYLLDPKTKEKTPLSIDKKMSHHRLAIQCFSVAQCLRRNMCSLPSNGTQSPEIDFGMVQKCFPAELQYACRYWAHHLVGCLGVGDEVESENVLDELLIFLYQHFLHWLEAMSLLRLSSEVVGILDLLRKNIPDDQYPVLAEFIQDARRFVSKNRAIFELAPLQIYCTGLIFAPPTSVRRAFKSEIAKSGLSQLPHPGENWGADVQTLEGHNNTVVSVEFSPDGGRLLSGSEDIRLWEVSTGVLLQNYMDEPDFFLSTVTFSPDGRLWASSSATSVKLWDIAEDQEFRTIKAESTKVVPTGFYPEVTFSPNGRTLEHTKWGWNNPTSSMAFSSDSRRLASTAADGKMRLWNVDTGALERTFLEEVEMNWTEFFLDTDADTSAAYSVAFSPDDRLLACASDKIVRLWNAASGEIHHKLEGHSGIVTAVAFSSDGRMLATGSGDKTARLWDVQKGQLHQILTGHSNAVASVAFSRDNRLLATGSSDATIKLWDLTVMLSEQHLAAHTQPVSLIMFSPDSRRLASTSEDQSVKIWDTAEGTVLHTLKSHSDTLEYVFAVNDVVELFAFSLDGSMLASLVYKTIQVWDVETGDLMHTFQGHDEKVRSLAFSPDGQLLASCSNDRTICLWNIANGSHRTLQGHQSFVLAISFSPDGQSLASGSSDGRIKIWDTRTGSLCQEFEQENSVRALTYHPQRSDILASSGSLGKGRGMVLWNLAPDPTGRVMESYQGAGNLATFSPNGQWIVSSTSDDSVLQVWDVETGSLLQSWDLGIPVKELRFSRDGSSLLTELGSFNVSSNWQTDPSTMPPVKMEIAIENGQWVILQGQKALWLPLEFRPTNLHSGGKLSGVHIFTTEGNKLAIGHSSGRVSFMSFRI